MPSLPTLKLPSIPNPSLRLSVGRRSGADVVGLDIQPGFVGAVQARVNGAILAQRAAALPLAGDTVREGEVIDRDLLVESLRELFRSSGLGKRVRVGVANQRTVMRMLELPPVTDRKELAAAVRFQAQEQVPMPLADAVLDFHSLGVVETPGGPRQRILLVAAQRDMIERLLAVLREAGLRPEGVDLSAFALIRSLHRPEPDPEHTSHVLYLNVDGLTNLAIAEGTVCRFTRVVGGGLEGLASELAERRGIALTEARALLAAVDLEPPEAVQASPVETSPNMPGVAEYAQNMPQAGEEDPNVSAGFGASPTVPDAPAAAEASSDADVRMVLENGIREISGQVRTSLEFYRSQDGGGEVSRVALSGSALDLPGFPEALQGSLGLEVRGEAVGLADESLSGTVSTHRLAVAAGLATTEAPQ
jgi:type IV pilus assembly protein PilM